MKIELASFILGIQDYMLPCLNKKLFGIDCPGCGLQRSLLFLAKGDFGKAFEMYPPIFILVPFILFIITSHFVKFRFANIIHNAFGIISGITILTNYIIKITNLTF